MAMFHGTSASLIDLIAKSPCFMGKNHHVSWEITIFHGKNHTFSASLTAIHSTPGIPPPTSLAVRRPPRGPPLRTTSSGTRPASWRRRGGPHPAGNRARLGTALDDETFNCMMINLVSYQSYLHLSLIIYI